LVPPSKSVTQREPNVQYVPAPPPRREETAAKRNSPLVKTVADASKTAPEAPGTAIELPSTVPPPADAPATREPETSPAESPVAEKSSVSTPEVFPPRLPAGTFTVQVASFDATTPENAKKFKARIEDSSDYDVMLIPSTDGKHLRACIGTYPNRDAALKARDDLAKIREFKDCFIRAADE
jgi:hypothetical protein